MTGRDGWRTVSRRGPCPLCQSTDWCWVSEDGGAVICGRTEDAPVGWRSLKAAKDGRPIYQRDQDRGSPRRPDRRPSGGSGPKVQPPPDRDWPALCIRYQGQLEEEQLQALALELTVQVDALRALGMGWAAPSDLAELRAGGGDGWSREAGAFVFPERDGLGRIVGVSLRAPGGAKGAPSRASRGLVVPSGLEARPDPVLVVEGASDVAACHSIGLTAVGRPSNAGGADEIAELLQGREILVLGEYDPKPNGHWPGRDGACSVAKRIATVWKAPVRWCLPPEGSKDVRSWLGGRVSQGLDLGDEAACQKVGQELVVEILAAAEKADPESKVSGKRQRVRAPMLRSFNDIQRTEINWLWSGRLPGAKLCLLAGDPGGGKSTLSLDLAARISRGTPWPDGQSCARGAVLLLSAEDDPEDTTGPRLDAAGADCRLLFELSTVEVLGEEDEGNTVEPAQLHDLTTLKNRILEGVLLPDGERVPFRLVIIDPLSAYLGGIDTNRNSDVRVVLRPLADLAQETGVTILAVLHPRKGAAQNPLDLVSGSRAFIEAARAAWMVVTDPEDATKVTKLLMPLKANLLPPGTPGLRFKVEEADNGAVRIAWLDGEVTRPLEEVLGAQFEDHEDRSARGEAREFLRETLANGPCLVSELKKEAEDGGFAWSTVKRAKTGMGVVARKQEGVTNGPWLWHLPAKDKEDGEEDQESPNNGEGARTQNGGLLGPLDPLPPGRGKEGGFSSLEDDQGDQPSSEQGIQGDQGDQEFHSRGAGPLRFPGGSAVGSEEAEWTEL